MKALISYLYLIICFNYIHLKVEDEQEYFEIKITNILSNDIPIGGFLLLQTEGIALMRESKPFSLSIIKEEDKSQYPISCTFYQFDGTVINGKDIITCKIESEISIQKGKYYLSLEKEIIIDEQYIKILPFNLNNSFNIIEGEELIPYSKYIITKEFSSNTDSTTIKFSLFEDVTLKESSIYFDDIEFKCEASGNRVRCPVTASNFPQDKRFQNFNVYYIDSQGNKKKNHLILPIEITLGYLEKKSLKIEVSNLLTNCLTNHGFIVFDTTDKTLENVLFSKNGFYLNVKKENLDSQSNKLFCNFHKISGENTKILCEKNNDFEDGTYNIEEYISEGPIKDDEDRISKSYEIIVPNFNIKGKFVYSSKEDNNAEFIFDFLLREKIYLNYENKEEVKYIFLYVERYNGLNKYILGNSELESKLFDKDYIKFKVPKSNFEKSGIYYFEKINAINEKERLYILPPIEVSVPSNESKYINLFNIFILIIALLF